ncbi:MAG: RNA degradosome polyphosphate kinase [Gemmatimonadetes bacterium 13_1_40CM_66_11]|nr:MAG: RNA degradosome polyphosphate kinase [Gemmatimonadetes bacterium 13_1_40CM_66_11]
MAAPYQPAFPPDHYLNRELSWLEFNARVLEEAADKTNPLLERLKFAAIFSSNLDEFFEVRVAGLQQQLYAGIEPQDYGADGLDPAEQLSLIATRVHALVAEQHRLLDTEIMPGLAAAGIQRVALDTLDAAERDYLDKLFAREIYPVLTPLAIDPGHPFPHVHNKSLNIVLLVENAESGQQLYGVVQVPALLDRVVALPGGDPDKLRFVLLEEIIAAHLGDLFGGFKVLAHTVFRVTRNTDLAINEDDAEDLLQTIEETLRQRILGDAVRLEILASGDARFAQMLMGALDLRESDVYRVNGPGDLTALMALHRGEGFRTLRDEALVPRPAPAFASGENPFDVIRAEDVLVHHPYESFGAVVDFIDRAADDPQVLAIKQTLYRTSGGSPIISALARAAQNGKQVTALVELKARYDEENNIVWARELEQAGVHVVYGIVGLKTHCKAALVVRRERSGLRRYVHLSTGNYNPTTARIYTDIGLFTADPAFGEDVSEMFNLLTGYSQTRRWRKLVVAPVELRERVIALIDRERRHAEAGHPARITVKMNALVEVSVIDALYRASQAGVEIDLVIRGICSLRAGLPGVSERIRVVSTVDRFLEHSRVFYFSNGGNPEVFLASADWMPRNFFRRIEVMFPVEAAALKARIVDRILPTILGDNVKARLQNPDGSYRRLVPQEGEATIRSQTVLHSLARGSAVTEHGGRRLFVPVLRRNGKKGKGETRRSATAPRVRRGAKGSSTRKVPDDSST